MESKNQVGEVMGVTIERIKDMIDVNTVVGDPITTPDGTTIIPVSKLSIGFASGGSDFVPKTLNGGKNPFGGGSGGGIKIDPIAFLIVTKDRVRLLPVAAPAGGAVEKVIDMMPEIVDKVAGMVEKKKEEKAAEDEVF